LQGANFQAVVFLVAGHDAIFDEEGCGIRVGKEQLHVSAQCGLIVFDDRHVVALVVNNGLGDFSLG